MPQLIYLAAIVVAVGGTYLLVCKWRKEEPIALQKEKLQDAVTWKRYTIGMARDLQHEMETNPAMSPHEIRAFIEQWGAGSIDDITTKLAIQEKEEHDNEERVATSR